MTLNIYVGDRILEIKASVNEIRRFLSHYERVVAGEPQTQRRFVFRGGDTATTRTLVMDLRNVHWVMHVEETSAE